MHVIAAKAVALKEALEPSFREYAAQIIKNSQCFAAALQEEGFTLISGGTDNHLVLIDVRNLGLTGKEAEERLDEVYITTNKNTIPFDPESPFVTSGIRLGTAAVTTRGMDEQAMDEIASIMALTLQNPQSESAASEAKERVAALTKKFPLYAGLQSI